MINTETLQTINGLLKTKIPLKRSVTQRQKYNKNVNNSDNSDDDKKEQNQNLDDSDYDAEDDRADAYKRQNDGGEGISMVNIENLASSIYKSIEAAKNLPIAKHKTNIM